jgi:protein-tyrosine phosphatase
MKRILVVCEGNICRSPMAEGLLAHALPQSRVHSAGLNALSGMPADETAVRLMRSRDIDISAHRAVQLTSALCQHTDLVLVMSTDQRKHIEQKYPFACGRVFRIGEFSKRDVPDPYRQPERAFREALELIEQGAGEWLRRIHQI